MKLLLLKFTVKPFPIFSLVLLLFCSVLYGQNDNPIDTIKGSIPAEEVPLSVKIEKVGTFTLNVLIYDDEVFIPVSELFKAVKINVSLVKSNSFAAGFFIDEDNKYFIDAGVLKAELKGVETVLSKSDIIINETDMYLKSILYKKIFDVEMQVDLKKMSIYMNSRNELPITIDEERQSLRELKTLKESDIVTDVTFPRRRRLFSWGFLDWQVLYSHRQPETDDYYNFNASFGSELLGGDLNLNLSGNKENAFDKNNSYMRWRYVTEENWFRQGITGEIQAVSGLFSNLQGVQLTNAPPVTRKIQGGYKIFDQTYPNWDVELYVNNEMIAYTRANESGYFEFTVPLLYGSNFITLKFYGPSGEIQSSDRVIQVPYTFLPKGDFEYYLTAGRQKYDMSDLLSEASFNWGVTDFMTVGAGNTYIDNSDIPKFYPNANLSLKVLSGLILSGQYFHGLKGRATLNLLLPSQASFEFSYIKYEENDYFNQGDAKDEKNLALFVPFSFGNVSANFRLNANEITRTSNKYLYFYPGLFVSYGRLQASVLINSIYESKDNNYINQSFSSSYLLSYRFFSDLLVRNQTDVDHRNNQVRTTGFYVDKNVFGSGWISLYVTKDFVQDNFSGGINFRFYFPFTTMSTNYRSDQSGWEVQQSFYGSVGFDDYKYKFITDNRFLSSRAGFTFVPFLDGNNNGKIDPYEKCLNTNLEVKMESGRAIKYDDGKNVWYTDLDPYSNYKLKINPFTLDNPLYRPKYKTYEVYTDPNRFKPVPIPVYVTGMVEGFVVFDDKKQAKGVSGINIILESENGVKITRQTFSDGEFIFDDVAPGKYKIYADPNDISARGFKSEILYKEIDVKSNPDGDIINNVELYFTKVPK